MRRSRGFKEIQPKESIGYTEDQRSSTEALTNISSEATDYQEINGSQGMDMEGLKRARENYGQNMGQDLPRNDLSQPPEQRQVTIDEIFPPMGIPPMQTSHHPSIPCPPVDQDGMVSMNPFPYLFKSKYDFKFDTFREKVLKDIKRSKSIVEQTGMQTPEREGGFTSILLTGTEIDGELWLPPHKLSLIHI